MPQRKPPIDVRKDLQPVMQTTSGHMLLAVSPNTALRSVKDVIDYARQHPGKLANASSGNGTPGHVGFELLAVQGADRFGIREVGRGGTQERREDR